MLRRLASSVVVVPTITLTASGAVTVSGAPTLSLSDGATASYASGSGSDALASTPAAGTVRAVFSTASYD